MSPRPRTYTPPAPCRPPPRTAALGGGRNALCRPTTAADQSVPSPIDASLVLSYLPPITKPGEHHAEVQFHRGPLLLQSPNRRQSTASAITNESTRRRTAAGYQIIEKAVRRP